MKLPGKLPFMAIVFAGTSCLTSFFNCTLAAADQNDFRCLKSIGTPKPVRLQFTFQADKDDRGYVTYQRGSGPIQVRKTSEKEKRRASGGRPSEFEMVWEEITPDGSGGSYGMVSQGARLYDFKYIRKKDGRVLKFEEESEASTETGCRWTKQ